MDQTLRSSLPSSDAEPSTGEVLPSIVLHYISLLSGLGNIDDQNRSPNIKRASVSTNNFGLLKGTGSETTIVKTIFKI